MSNRLESALSRLRDFELPTTPGNFDDRVLRRVRQQRAQSAPVVGPGLLLARRELALGTLALAMLTSALLAGLSTAWVTSVPSPAGDVIGFESLTRAPAFTLERDPTP